MKEKPKFKVGQVFEFHDRTSKWTWTIKSIRQVVDYPSGKHVHFGYVVELTSYFKDGDVTKNKAYYGEKGFMELLKPEEKQWYSISAE